tara:strand:+ start:530 stop:685 length:156 start_codon:yes stop_codon:yes gene_type:complete
VDEEDPPRVYVRKNREPYSGMVLDSAFRLLRGGIVVMVVLGVLFMFDPFIF